MKAIYDGKKKNLDRLLKRQEAGGYLDQAKREDAKTSLPEKLDSLPFEDSQYGGQWLNHEKVPSWVKDLDFPTETAVWKYYMTKTGNLKRYEKKEVPKNG